MVPTMAIRQPGTENKKVVALSSSNAIIILAIRASSVTASVTLNVRVSLLRLNL
jgi:hypothetical protein